MKEIRVYVVASEDENWQYATDEAFISRAERDGNVWSLAGFGCWGLCALLYKRWNGRGLLPEDDYSDEFIK